jgi:hypothetical protein
MKHPHKRVAGLALLLVVLTIGLTSPLLTMLSTMLLSHDANDTVRSNQIISLLAGHWGNTFLQIEVAISASALLVFASNTAIIGAYHVFLALSRMGFLPDVVLQRNKLRGTPHYAIVLATGIPVLVLILVVGNINILADMYAFGLLGAFTLTCLGLDIVRYRDWKNARRAASVQTHDRDGLNGHRPLAANNTAGRAGSLRAAINKLWFRIGFWLGVLTTFLVALAWSTNLVTKPLATAFGGGVTLLGMSIAYIHYVRQERTGRVPVPVAATRAEGRLPDSILAVLTSNNGRNEAIIRAAVNCAHEKRPVVFLYTAKRATQPKAASMMEIVDPYLDDLKAKEYFARAEGLALKAKIPLRRYIYVQEEPDAVSHAWQVIHPHDTVMAAGDVEQCSNINADRIRYELTHAGKVAHFLKHW